MEHESNLAVLCKSISNKLLDSMHALDILDEITDSDAKCALLLKNIENNTKLAFNEIEECRKMIFILDD